MGRRGPAGKRPACSGRLARPLSGAECRPVAALLVPLENPLSLFRRAYLTTALVLGSLVLSAALAPDARAQLRAGSYTVEGQNPDGTPYEGTFELLEGPSAAWIARWNVGNAQIIGLGLIQGGMLALSFSVEGRPGIAVYGVEPDGSLRGTWTSGGGLGTEVLKAQ